MKYSGRYQKYFRYRLGQGSKKELKGVDVFVYWKGQGQ
jgi:hypothetical protein